MKINVQSIHFDADRNLLDYIETKIAKLDSFNSFLVEEFINVVWNVQKYPNRKRWTYKILSNARSSLMSLICSF